MTSLRKQYAVGWCLDPGADGFSWEWRMSGTVGKTDMLTKAETTGGELYLVRHGETAGESSIRFYGATDIPLSDTGRRQMQLAGEALRGIRFRTAVMSPLSRSREGAELVLNGSGVRQMVVEDFREIHFGEWEGLTAAEIEERFPELHRTWKIEGRLTAFPGGDSREEFFRRVAEAASRVFHNIELPAVAVLHKGVIKGILAGLLGGEHAGFTDRPIELGSIQRLKRNGSGWTLAAENETAHLGHLRMEHS